MSARNYWDDEAGPWVAYRDEPQYGKPGETRRSYLHSAYSGATALHGLGPGRNVRFNTKAEALEAAKQRWPLRTKGCRIGAENVGLWTEEE